MRTIANPNQTRRSARWAIAGCAVAFTVLGFACGGGGEEGGDGAASPGLETAVVQATVALPPVPPDSADKAGLLVYRDTLSGQVLALNLATAERLPVKGILPSAVGSITSFDCSWDGRLIAYANSAANGTVTIISFAGEGARAQPVEVQGGVAGMAWSPQADRMAMTVVSEADYRLAILDVANGQTTLLPPVNGLPGTPRWSPDGQRLVVEINNRGISDIYVLDVAAPNPVKVSTRPAAFTPDWSPDGQTIVFTAGDDQGGQPQLYAVGADGTNERKLTTSTTQKFGPRWSRDGSLISFVGLVITPVVSALPVLAHNSAIWVSGADGTNELPVTDLTLDAQPLGWCLPGAWL